jgi:hypothetical protein
MLHRLPAAIALAACVCLIAVTPAGADQGMVPRNLRNPEYREIHGSPRLDRIRFVPTPLVVHHTDGFDWGTAATAGAGFALAIGAGWTVFVMAGRRRRVRVPR